MNTNLVSNSNLATTTHNETITTEGLDDLFKWASEMVADNLEGRAKRVREEQIRRQVLQLVQQTRDDQVVQSAALEVTYLQRRVIALLQKLQEYTEKNNHLNQIVSTQCIALENVPQLEQEIKQLKQLELRVEEFQVEQQELLTALTKIKRERDILDELLEANETENDRLTSLLSQVRQEMHVIKSRRWWHFLFPRKA